eukprot:scaffold173433_cov40-Attheya_sp.AAC.1
MFGVQCTWNGDIKEVRKWRRLAVQYVGWATIVLEVVYSSARGERGNTSKFQNALQCVQDCFSLLYELVF